MNPRTKFLIGFLLVAGTSGYLMASSIRETGMYYFTPSELAAKVSTDPGFRDVGVKVGARVVPGSIVRDDAGREVQFIATDGARTTVLAHERLAPEVIVSSEADVNEVAWRPFDLERGPLLRVALVPAESIALGPGL